MKVLYFHQHFSTPAGATGIRSYAMACKLIEKGYEVTMICGSYHGGDTGLVNAFQGGCREGIVDGVHVIEFNLEYSNHDGFLKRTAVFIKFALQSIRLVFSRDYDVLFATTTPLTAGIPGIVARWLRGKSFVFEVRDLWPELPREMGVIKNPVVLQLMTLLEWLSYRSANYLIGLSPGIVDGIARCGVNRSRIAMIPNGCDLQIFSAKNQAWRPDGVSNTDFMAVYSGTHGVANGLDAVLDAAALLKKRQRTDIKIVLIGQGKLKPDLESRVKKEKLDNVVFHEPVNKKKLTGLLVSTDIGLQILDNIPAFFYGTSPNKFFDYIAAGLPVLINYPGWIADIIAEQSCGFSVPSANAQAFADAIEAAASDRSQLKKMGVNAHKLAETEFNRDKLASEFVGFLENAVSDK